MNRFSLTSQLPADTLFTTKIGNILVNSKILHVFFFLILFLCSYVLPLHWFNNTLLHFNFFFLNNLWRSITKQDLEFWLCSALVIQGVRRIDSMSQLQGEVWTCLTGITAGQHEMCPPTTSPLPHPNASQPFGSSALSSLTLLKWFIHFRERTQNYVSGSTNSVLIAGKLINLSRSTENVTIKKKVRKLKKNVSRENEGRSQPV